MHLQLKNTYTYKILNVGTELLNNMFISTLAISTLYDMYISAGLTDGIIYTSKPFESREATDAVNTKYKSVKYSTISSAYEFFPFPVYTLGSWDTAHALVISI